MPSLATIIEDLARAQSELLRAADAVPADRWKTRPAEEGRWLAVSCSDDVRGSTRHPAQSTVTLEPKVVREKEEILAGLRGVRSGRWLFIRRAQGPRPHSVNTGWRIRFWEA